MAALRTLIDRQAIVDLVHDYARLVDDGRPDEVAELFTDDCTFRSTRGRNGTSTGRDAVRERMHLLLSTFRSTSHHVSNIQVTFTGPDRAEGLTYLYAWHDFTEERPIGHLWARYVDVFDRTPDGWRIAERSLHVTGEKDFAFGWLPPHRPGADPSVDHG